MSEMSHFRRVEELFHAAQSLHPEERAAFLDQACGTEASLRSEVESLLAAHPVGTAGVWRNLAESLGVRPPFLGAGDVVGRFRIVELIGEGGMGEVYRAEQLQPLKREVALKIVKAGMDTRQVLMRFENERQALALMSHSGVARVFDAGATSAGRLYFAMELVKGEPITEFCDSRHLPLVERLELFRRVCEAVQHAHQKGIIHRDLKPSNILVEEQDGRVRPKIIDFGIAKAVTPDATEQAARTGIGQPVGTPEYMSPEQADFGAVIDTRTDVYSLGLVLFELLAGGHPFDIKKLRRSTPQEVYDYLCYAEPERPSIRAARSTEAATARRCDSSVLRRSLTGDLDWIVAKALEKEPDRRYAAVSELAADIGRHLHHEPVLAAAPSRAYRARKFARRHRPAVATAAAVLLTLVVAIGGISAALVRARAAEAEALRQAALANDVTEFLEGLLTAEDPYRREPDDRTVRAVVSQAAQHLEEGVVEDPEVFARLAASLAAVMLNLGLRENALELTLHAIDQLRDTSVARAPPHLELLYQQSRAESMLGRYENSRLSASELVSLASTILPADSPRLGVYLKQRGDAENLPGGTHEKQQQWHRRAAAVLRAARDVSPEDLGSVLHALARSTPDAAECSKLANEELVIWLRRLGDEHPRVAEARQVLGRCARLAGNADEAERHLREAVELQTRVLGASHPLTFHSISLRLDALYALGRFEDARSLVDDALAVARDVGQRSAMATMLNESFTYLPGEADFVASRARLQEALTIFLELYDGESEWSLMVRHTIADGFADEGMRREAREQYLHVLRSREELGLPRNYFSTLLLENLATVERRIGFLDEAERHIDEALELYPKVGWDPRDQARAWLSKATLLFKQRREAESKAALVYASSLYAACEGPRTFLDLRYEAAFRATRRERALARDLVRSLYKMGVNPNFLIHEPELLALFGEADLRRLADEVEG